MSTPLTPEQSNEIRSLVRRQRTQTPQGKSTLLGHEADTPEELEELFLRLFVQDGKTNALIQGYLDEDSSQALNEYRREYSLDAEQLKTLHGIAKAESIRDGSGNFWILGDCFDSLEAAKGALVAECVRRRLPPLSVLANYREQRTEIPEPRPTVLHSIQAHIAPVFDTSTKLERLWYRVRRRARKIGRWLKRTPRQAEISPAHLGKVRMNITDVLAENELLEREIDRLRKRCRELESAVVLTQLEVKRQQRLSGAINGRTQSDMEAH